MMALSVDSSVELRTLSATAPARLLPAGNALWRVLDGRGLVIGHIQEVAQGGDIRFRARRYHAATRAFRDLGDFWSRDQAVECLRFAR